DARRGRRPPARRAIREPRYRPERRALPRGVEGRSSQEAASRERHRDLAPHGASPVAADDHDGHEGMDAGRGGGRKARRRERVSWSRRGHPGAHRRTDLADLSGGRRYARHDDFAPTYARRDVSDRFEIPADLA